MCRDTRLWGCSHGRQRKQPTVSVSGSRLFYLCSSYGAAWERSWPEAEVETNGSVSPVLEVLTRKGDLGCKMGPGDPCPLLWVLSLTSTWTISSPSLGSGWIE